MAYHCILRTSRLEWPSDASWRPTATKCHDSVGGIPQRKSKVKRSRAWHKHKQQRSSTGIFVTISEFLSLFISISVSITSATISILRREAARGPTCNSDAKFTAHNVNAADSNCQANPSAVWERWTAMPRRAMHEYTSGSNIFDDIQ